MKLYVDDIREAPDESWVLCRTITEAISFIARYGTAIEEISLDHDISFEVRVGDVYRPFPSPDDYTAVAHYIGVYYHIEPQKFHPKVSVHSANPEGCERIKKVLADYGLACEINPQGPAYRKK